MDSDALLTGRSEGAYDALRIYPATLVVVTREVQKSGRTPGPGGAPPAFLLQWATSDARHFRAAGIPVVQYGPAGPGIHAFDEAVPVEQLVRCAQVYIATALAFLDPDERF